MRAAMEISELSAKAVTAHLEELGALLNACVHAGASIGFVLPHALEDSMAFWSGKILPGVAAGSRILLVAKAGGRIAGTVQLGFDTMPNQPHRADVSKLLVHPDFRRRGIARALMVELERRAAGLGRSLLTLDTRTGDTAEPLYRSLGYETAGIIPGYAVDALEPGKVDATTIMYKVL